jgi:hypothetical protein
VSDPIRLLDETSSPALAAVLRSADADGSANAEREIQRISAAAALAIGAGSAGVSGGLAASSSLWLRRSMWVALSAVVAVGSAGIWRAHEAQRAASVDVAPRVAEPEARAGVVVAAPLAPPSSAPPVVSVRVDDLPAAHASTSSAVRADAAVAALGRDGRAASPHLPDELSMIDAVRGALAAGQPAQALERLEAYRHAYPHASFDVEGDVLEVQALAALGRTDAARAKARRFLAAHPGSPYEKRIEAEAKLTDTGSP